LTIMIKKRVLNYILVVFICTIVACSGLNFSQLAPEAIDFHPQRVALFPIEVWNHKEIDSRAMVEQITAGSLVAKRLFTDVTDVEILHRQLLANDEFRKTKDEYFSKLRLLGFSDPELSRKIGDFIQVDAFLLLFVDEWKYYEKDDKKMAQVGLSMEMYDVATGKLMWKAHHSITNDYMLIKPELPDVARAVVNKMAVYMPH
jgi:hypothetical protein